MYTHFAERDAHDLEDPRPAPVDPVVAASSDVLVPLALIPGHVWDALGWWDQIQRNKKHTTPLGGLGRATGDGLIMRRLRLNAGLSQRELGDRLGISRGFVKNMELGDKPIPAKRRAAIELALGGVIAERAA